MHTRFKKAQSGNRGGRSAKSLPALLADALIERTFMTFDGRRRKITGREAIVTQMANKSASADLRATNMLIAMMKDVEQKAGVASPPARDGLSRITAERKTRHYRVNSSASPLTTCVCFIIPLF